MKISFRERLQQNEVLVGDGAMGTMLYSKGIYINRCFDELNIINPTLVQSILKSYVESGADIIETNTFGANRIKLSSHGLDNKLNEINYSGVKIAREIVGEKAFVAGSMGPLGRPMEPIGSILKKDAMNVFREQAIPLFEGGVDLFMLETFNDLLMLKLAILAVREVCDKPIIASISFSDDKKTIYGHTPAQVAQQLDQMDIDVIGVNCSTGPQPMLTVIEEMAAATSKKLSASPNAGSPRMIDGRYFYMASPEYFAEYAKRFIQTGVSIVGGCCGSTDEHIRAIKSAVKALQPSREFEKISIVTPEVSKEKKTFPRILSGLAQEIVNKKFVTSIEMTPPRSCDVSKALKGAKLIKKNRIDAVNIPDGPRASARISPLALAVIIEREVGLETILHYTCRDRNILGMQSDLLGAAALGLKNMLIVTGDPPKLGDYPSATAVFNVDSIGLLKIADNLNKGQDIVENPIEQGTSFFLGAGANPGAINYDEEIERLKQKIDAGAEYILTQPIFEQSLFDKFLNDCQTLNIPIIAGILPLASFKNAEFLHNEVPGMSIPQEIRHKLQHCKNPEDGRKIGIEVAQEMLAKVKKNVQGVYLMPPFGRYESAIKVLEAL